MWFYRRRIDETYLCYYDQALVALIDEDVEEGEEGDERGRGDVSINTLALNSDVGPRVCTDTSVQVDFS